MNEENQMIIFGIKCPLISFRISLIFIRIDKL
jgi:hypothetical protein